MLIEFVLSDLDCLSKVVIGQLGIDDDVAMIGLVRWFDATGIDCLPWGKRIFMGTHLTMTDERLAFI